MSLIDSFENLFEFIKPLNSYSNMDFLLKVYSKPELWDWFYEQIFNEYSNDPNYLKCVEKFKKYGELIDNKPNIYYKLTTSTNKSKGFQYKLGLNVDSNEFKPFGCCSGGGLYFCELKDIYQFENFGKYLTPIIVPKNIPIYKESHGPSLCDCKNYYGPYIKFKAPVIFTLPRIRIDDIRAINLITNTPNTSEKNKRFSTYYLYKSNVVDELNLFLSFVPKNSLWSKEMYIAMEKRDLLLNQFTDPTVYRVIEFAKLFRHLKSKLLINYLIDVGFPFLYKKLMTQKQIQSPIQSLNLDVDDFINGFNTESFAIFESNKAVIAGSYVLKWITNSKFKTNDLDIYINIDDFNKMKSSINKPISTFMDTYKLCWKIEEPKHDPTNGYIGRYNMTDIEFVTELCLYSSDIKFGHLKKYQLIVIKNDPSQFIKSNFDFDLCAIGFDFATKKFINLNVKPPTDSSNTNVINYRNLTIQDSYIIKMTGKESDGYSNYRATKTIQRIIKYAERGFYVQNWKEFLIEIRDKMCNE